MKIKKNMEIKIIELEGWEAGLIVGGIMGLAIGFALAVTVVVTSGTCR